MKKLMTALLITGMSFPYAVADDDVRTLTVTGIGRVEVVPDQAHVTYQVTDEEPAALGQSAAISKAMTSNRKKVQADAAYIKSIIGQDGQVEIVPSVVKDQHYDQKTQKEILDGYKVISTIRVTVQGPADQIDQKLAQLFDSSKVSADDVSEPSFDLSEKAASAAKLQAYKQAVSNGVDTAQAQLEPGEVLGAALQRGYQVQVPRPQYENRAMAAAPMMGAGPGSQATQAVVESGKVAVEATINFLFSVTGLPSRIATQGAQTVVSNASGNGKKVPPPTGCADKGC